MLSPLIRQLGWRPRPVPALRRRVRLEVEPLESRLVPDGTCSCGTLLAAPPEDDSAVARIVNGTPTSGFPSVGLVGDRFESFCTGTLIAPRYVLTAAHCAEGLSASTGRFTVGGRTYATSRIFIHPNYRPDRIGEDAANDIAIFELSQAVQGITPSPIYRQVPRVGQLLTLVGFGAGGTGSGHNGDFGIKRVGTTPIDGVSSRLITWVFNNNQESNTAPGDSGGPAFLPVGGVYYVAGVTSGGDKPNAGIGDRSFDTRVDVYAGWIDSIVGNSPTPTPTPTPTPGGDQGDTLATAAAFPMSGSGAGKAAGAIASRTDQDFFKFLAPRTGYVTFNLRATSNLDPVLALFNAGGQRIALNDDWGWSLNSRIRIWVTAGRTYYVRASGYGGSTGSYQLESGSIVRTRAAARSRDLSADVSFHELLRLLAQPSRRLASAMDAVFRHWSSYA